MQFFEPYVLNSYHMGHPTRATGLRCGECGHLPAEFIYDGLRIKLDKKDARKYSKKGWPAAVGDIWRVAVSGSVREFLEGQGVVGTHYSKMEIIFDCSVKNPPPSYYVLSALNEVVVNRNFEDLNQCGSCGRYSVGEKFRTYKGVVPLLSRSPEERHDVVCADILFDKRLLMSRDICAELSERYPKTFGFRGPLVEGSDW